ncbi:hypothetical protein EDB19DRAFT_1727617 [Suillus lakei]|nr:hypothetical protein EDB19DRAFT_1727617 [Suillus lakei]
MILTEKLSAEAEIDAPPPAYDTLSIHGGVPSIPTIAIVLAHDDGAGPSTSAVTDMHEVEPPSRSRPWARTLPRSRSNIDFTTQHHNDAVVIPIPPVDVDKLLPERPQLDSRQTVPAESASSSCKKRKHAKARKTKSGPSSWLSLLPFTSSKTTKHVRQSVLTLIQDLILLPPTSSINQSSKSPQLVLADPHETLASCAQSCSAKNLSLSALLQEPAVAGHTPIYWAIALLPLTPATLSDMRKACLVASNQTLFQHLRLTAGLCASGLRSATDGLLLGQRSPDDVHIEVGPDGAFAATLDIAMWQKRIRAVGSVSVEFIASGRIFALTFFTTDRPQPNSKCPKSKRGVGPLHVSLSLLEHSLPTYVDAAVIIDRPPPLPSPGPSPRSSQKKGRGFPKVHIHSASFSSGEKDYGFENRAGFGGCQAGKWDFNYDGQAHTRLASPSSPSSPGHATSSSSHKHAHKHAQKHAQTLLPPPSHPPPRATHTPKKQLVKLKNASLGSGGHAPVVLRLNAGESMLACRTKNHGDPHALPHPTTKPDAWSEHGTGYVSAVVVLLGEQDGGGLMFDTSPHIAPDGSLRARLEAKLVKTEEGGKECIIC